MRRTYLIGLIGLVVSLLLLLTTINVAKQEQVTVPFNTDAGVSGRLSLALPTTIYTGDNGNINLSVDLADEVDIYPVLLIVHLEAGFDEVEPAGIINVNLLNPEPVRLEWRMRTATAGDYPATLWVWADNGDGKDLVMAKDFQVRSKLYLGARVAHIRIASAVMGGLAFAWLLGVSLRLMRYQSDQN